MKQALRLRALYRTCESTSGIKRLTYPKPFRKWVTDYLGRFDNDQLVASMRLYSPIGIDNGHTNQYQGMRRSTMDLYQWSEGHSGIEWDVPGLETGASIGIWHTNKVVYDYDGVFELNEWAIWLLEMNGYDCSLMKDECQD